MKIKLLVTSLIVVFSVGRINSQTVSYPVDNDSKLICYTKVKELAGVSKNDIFDRALGWINSYYKNPADVLRENDKANGKLLCKARFKLMGEPDKSGFQKDQGNVQYSLIIEAKEGKYRYKLTEINWKQPSYFPVERWMDTKNQYYTKDWDWNLKYTDEQSHKIIAELEKYMSNPPKVKKDDW
ncbi:MAG: DUF4468 domain-containing protein [Bacteroidia bacterium]|nr:DUF4468 domain-containing protein [Bacteroidia bacterium]MCW5919997.1 DUF4468 domain-containing protein [Bacteroidota bacterium]MCC7513815.1 DUF4468 domain-containing protein [Bacteroidia bacterium]HCI58012.1 hypothetical protein [Bacteroidota bacterium]HMU78172.1 DUF4468 domain-containing protein [Bacteroidia bacterium]